MSLSSFLRKMTKNKITFEFQPPFQKFPILSAFKVLKKAWNFKTWGFFLQNSFSENRKDHEKQYTIIFFTPVLYMYVVCKGKSLVYNRNITSFFTLKNLVILSLRRNSYLSNRNGFFWNILWEVLIKIYRLQPLKSDTGGILKKSNSILVSLYIPRKYIGW